MIAQIAALLKQIELCELLMMMILMRIENSWFALWEIEVYDSDFGLLLIIAYYYYYDFFLVSCFL
jgi:hypothetical protein